MIELCAGSGDLTRAFRARGWDAWAFDIDPRRPVDCLADVRQLPIRGHFRFLWASPPCTEFALWGMPFHSEKRKVPDITILEACIKATELADGWIIENVRGACRWFAPLLGHYTTKIGPWYLWSNLPVDFPRLSISKGTCRGPLSKKSVRSLAPMHPLAVRAIADTVTCWLS